MPTVCLALEALRLCERCRMRVLPYMRGGKPAEETKAADRALQGGEGADPRGEAQQEISSSTGYFFSAASFATTSAAQTLSEPMPR
mmetsp:Transcript_165581/g.317876  ORF Transcript_165581/g.317876 Transcript_165581/m.317876 type:complete len:86 (-) Transcript_165581:261-518(-)